jgi:hypothetical protein
MALLFFHYLFILAFLVLSALYLYALITRHFQGGDLDLYGIDTIFETFLMLLGIFTIVFINESHCGT